MYEKENPETIQALFASIADQYDRTNAILSFRMHHRWNKALIAKTFSGAPPESLLDLCAGTGEIAYGYLRKAKSPCRAYLLDFCSGMLEVAKAKAERHPFPEHQLSFLTADAQAIPLPDASVDRVTIAYGIRNVQNPKKCIGEVFRVLKPGGRFGILELTQPKNPLMRFGHSLYLHGVLPVVGKCVAKNREAYDYLCRSIQHFSKPDVLEAHLQEAGFQETHVLPLNFGIATLILGTKSLPSSERGKTASDSTR